MKRQWFDDVFNADKEYSIPSRETTTIEDIEYSAKKQLELEAEPVTITAVLRKQSEVNHAF